MLLFKAGVGCSYLIEDNTIRKYDRLGKFIGIDSDMLYRDIIPGSKRVNVVSILQSNQNKVVFAVQNGQGLREYKATQRYTEICTKLLKEKTAIKTLSNSGVALGLAFTQILIVYREGINIDLALNRVGIVLGEELI